MSHDVSVEKINFPDIPEDILFPDELCRYLRDEIQAYARENRNLLQKVQTDNRKIEEKDVKIKKLETKLKEYEDVNDSVLVNPTHVTSAKIVEISKKLREKCAELESFKSKYFKLESHFNRLKETSTEEGSNSVDENYELKKEVKQLQEKLNAVINKLTELKNVNSQIKNDFNLANELLEKETGYDFNSLQMNNNWKGRVQIISELQDKNKQLKEKLRNMQDMQQIKIKNSAKFQETLKENAELKSVIEENKKRCEAMKARNKFLESEVKQIKAKLAMTNEHYEKDQNLISTLTAQISSFEEIRRTLTKEKDATLNKIKLERDNLISQLEHYKNIAKNLNEEVTKKNEELRNKSSKVVCTESKDFKVRQLEAERIKLLDLLEIQNKRLQEERCSNAKIQGVLRLEKQKCAKLEAALARTEAELTESNRYSSVTSLKSLRVAENSLRDQLELAEESIKALTTRLEIEQLERKMDFKEFSKILQNFVVHEDNEECKLNNL